MEKNTIRSALGRVRQVLSKMLCHVYDNAFRKTRAKTEGRTKGAGSGANMLPVFGAMAVLISAVEILLCFNGPLAFLQKPSLVVFPLFSINVSDEDVAKVTAFVEREIALTNSYSVISQNFIEDYYMRTDPESKTPVLRPVNYAEALNIARELDLERLAIGAIHSHQNGCELAISVRDVRSGELVHSGRFASTSLENLLQGVGHEGEPLGIQDDLSFSAKGIGFTYMVVLALLTLQFAIGVLALCGREPGALLEVSLAPAVILFLFAYIYARSANMDYMQRFVATQGQIQLAQSTALEQLYAFLRYGPLLLVNGGYYVWRTLQRQREAKKLPARHWILRCIGPWALPWVMVSSVLFAFAFPSIVSLDGIGVLAWFALVPLFLVLLTATPGMAVFYGVFFGTLQALLINYWHGTYNYVTLHLITIAIVVEYLLFMFPLVWVMRRSAKWAVLFVPAAWVVFDWVRSIGVLGYPWGIVGTSQYRFLPLIQLASITGVWGIGFVVVFCNVCIAWALATPAMGWIWFGNNRSADAVESRIWSRRRLFDRIQAMSTQALFPLGLLAAVYFVCMLVGNIILFNVQTRYSQPEVPSATIVLVQQNTDPRKHDYKESFTRLTSLTNEAVAGLPSKPDLVVWPEGAFKLDIGYWTRPISQRSYWGQLVREFLEFQRSIDSWLLSGTQDHVMIPTESGGQERKNFNSSVLFDPEGNIVDYYHKMHLVPFTEYFPLDKERFAGLYETFQKFDISDWGVGQERVVFAHDKMRFMTPICFEDVFSDHVRRYVLQGVDVILNISNDYWSLAPIEGRQHAIFALFRAVENQRPLLRSTCSGYTVAIEATGRIQPGSPEPYTAGYTVAQVPLPETPLTLYTRWGDWFPKACAVVVGLAIVALSVALVARKVRRGHFEAQEAHEGMRKVA